MEYEQINELKAIVENQYILWSGSSPYCQSKVEYSLSPISDVSTELKHVTECNYKGLIKIWAWIAKSKIKKYSDAHLDETHRRFKSLVEAKYQSESQ
jgi:hypothetical protein